jgi:hypothetical protein
VTARQTITITLVVESDDVPAAFEAFEDSVDRLLDAGTIQDAICEHVEQVHPVNVEIVASLCERSDGDVTEGR